MEALPDHHDLAVKINSIESHRRDGQWSFCLEVQRAEEKRRDAAYIRSVRPYAKFLGAGQSIITLTTLT